MIRFANRSEFCYTKLRPKRLIISTMKESNVSNITKRVEYYLPCKSLWLLDLKKYTCLELHKTYGEISIKQHLFNYLANLDNYIFAKFVSLLIIFAGEDDIVSNLSETDIAEMIGTSRSTIQKYVSKYTNLVFNVLAFEHHATLHNSIAGNDNYIACNSYQLLDKVFANFTVAKSATRIGASQKFKFKFKNLKTGNYFLTIYNKKTLEILNKKTNTSTSQPPIPFITLEKIEQNIDNQINTQTNFKHFNNPIYSPGFDVVGTPYPSNWYWYDKATFIKGRWYGAIHNLKKEDRERYLQQLGLTHELDLHNAMFYFMFALLPDTISEADKALYFELVKSGRLYDDAVDMFTTHAGGLLQVDVSPERSYIKERFQQYRNLLGKKKKTVSDIDYYFEQRFPTIRDWLLTQKQMQNKLAWIETDFMSRVCEKLSDGTIKFVWLHDAVYVSEEDSVRAQEIWDSVRDEFEAAFVK